MKSKKLYSNAAAAAILFAALAGSANASEIVVTHSYGEFENYVDTNQTSLDIRHTLGDSGLYLYLRGEINDHPISDMDDAAYAGLGYQYKNFGIEAASDENRYISYAYYANQLGDIEVRGGLYHGNNHSQGFKQTGLRSTIGYRLNESFSLGASYQVGNTTMRSTDDLYGIYLKLEY